MMSSTVLASLMEQAQKVIATLDKIALKLADEGTINHCELPLLSPPKADGEPSKPNVSHLSTASICNYEAKESQFANLLPEIDTTLGAHQVFDINPDPNSCFNFGLLGNSVGIDLANTRTTLIVNHPARHDHYTINNSEPFGSISCDIPSETKDGTNIRNAHTVLDEMPLPEFIREMADAAIITPDCNTIGCGYKPPSDIIRKVQDDSLVCERQLFAKSSAHNMLDEMLEPKLEMWPELMKKAKAGGLNTMETYVFWNFHEHVCRRYDFEGGKDFVRFFKTMQGQGLYGNLGIGPYACAEWNYGGFPMLLHNLSGFKFRTNNQVYKDGMATFTKLIVDMCKKDNLFDSQGGTIILAEIENEWGNIMEIYKEDGRDYINWCSQLAQKYHFIIIRSVLFTGSLPLYQFHVDDELSDGNATHKWPYLQVKNAPRISMFHYLRTIFGASWLLLPYTLEDKGDFRGEEDKILEKYSRERFIVVVSWRTKCHKGMCTDIVSSTGISIVISRCFRMTFLYGLSFFGAMLFTFEGKTDSTEPWYGTTYSLEKISGSVIEQWMTGSSGEHLHLSAANLLISLMLSKAFMGCYVAGNIAHREAVSTIEHIERAFFEGSLIDMKLEKHKNLREDSRFFWKEIIDGTFKFDREEYEVEALKLLTRQKLARSILQASPNLLLGKGCYDIDIAIDNMLGKELCEKINECLLKEGEDVKGIGVLQCNIDQSKHLKTARMRLFDHWIDFMKLRAKDYCEIWQIRCVAYKVANVRTRLEWFTSMLFENDKYNNHNITIFVFDPGGYDSEPTMTKRPQVYPYGAKRRKLRRHEDYQSYVFDPGGSLVLQGYKSVMLWVMEQVLFFILEDKDNLKGWIMIQSEILARGSLVISPLFLITQGI